MDKIISVQNITFAYTREEGAETVKAIDGVSFEIEPGSFTAIIGKNGSMLKKISTEAREDCERFMGTKVFLQTWVKVKENWRDSQAMIRNFGYE